MRTQNLRVLFSLTMAVFLIFGGSGMSRELKILKPVEQGPAYDAAANEFQKYYREITGTELAIVTDSNEEDNYIVIGSDAVNRFVRHLIESRRFRNSNWK